MNECIATLLTFLSCRSADVESSPKCLLSLPTSHLISRNSIYKYFDFDFELVLKPRIRPSFPCLSLTDVYELNSSSPRAFVSPTVVGCISVCPSTYLVKVPSTQNVGFPRHHFNIMDVLQNQSPAAVLAAGFGSLYILYLLVQATITSHQRYLISRKHGCKPVPTYPHKDPIFGLDVFLKNYKLSNNGGFLDDVKRKYEKVIGGYTFTQLVLGERMILTAEPENIKAILATQFKDFELPPRRKVAFQPVFGHGIFSTDGGEWETSRALLRPNFSRSQVGDLDTFEVHISNMISKIPRDGSTVDLQALFFQLTMDSATDFLFGYSTNVLGSSGNSEAGQRFTDAFSYVTFKIGIE